MARTQLTIDRAKADLLRRGSLYTAIGGILSPGQVALHAICESGANKHALTSQGGPRGFWEVGYMLHPVGKVNGSGTAKAQNVDPCNIPSAVYGAEAQALDDFDDWLRFLPGIGVDPPDRDEVDAWATLLHLPYSIGWRDSRYVMIAGHRAGPVVHTDPIDCLCAALELDDSHLPAAGEQTDRCLRARIMQDLDWPTDCRNVARMPLSINVTPPRRHPACLNFPRFLGPHGLQEQLRDLAIARHLPE